MQKTAYEMRISDGSSDVCSSDLSPVPAPPPMRIDIISLFPEFVAQVAGHGVVGRAQERGLLSLQGWNPRDHAEGNYRRVDDRPFGGGPGMVMMIDPLRACIAARSEEHTSELQSLMRTSYAV